MGNDEVFRRFDDIEKTVNNLITVCKSLESTNFDLNNKIERLEQELQGKTKAEDNYAKQKVLVKSKIDSLLKKLNRLSEAAS